MEKHVDQQDTEMERREKENRVKRFWIGNNTQHAVETESGASMEMSWREWPYFEEGKHMNFHMKNTWTELLEITPF